MGESMLFLVLLAGCVIYGIDRKRRERKGALRLSLIHILKTGVQWRMLPSDFAPGQTVYYY